MRSIQGGPGRILLVPLVASAVAGAATAGAQDLPPLPPASPASVPAATAGVEERLRGLEEMNRRLLERNDRLSRQLEAVTKRLDAGDAAKTKGDAAKTADGVSAEETTGSGTDPGTSGAGGGSRGPGPTASSTTGATSKAVRKPGRVRIGPGFVLESPDEEYQLNIHNQTQVENRIYQQGGMRPVAGGFNTARERIIFNGRLTKPLEFEGSIEASYNTINLLNAFINFHYTDTLQVKFGRYKVPFGYEYFAISNTDLLNPERSLFGINYGFNRMPGARAWGQLFEKRLDYAVGIFDGPRNQQLDFNNDKDLIAYLNARPFQEWADLGALKYLNIGGSVDFGNQNNPVVPQALRTSVSQSTNANLANIAPAWMTFNNNVTETGLRELWTLHAAYYYKSLSLIGEWQSGYTTYARGNANTARVHLPIQGYYVAAGYFLTGETLEKRAQVVPRNPFDLRRGKFGLGAVELVARYSSLDLGPQVFSGGLADPNLWSNRAYAIDTGLNWYLNEYIKVYLDWQHSEFGNPVIFAPGRRQLTSDLFWLRFQIYF